MTQVRKTDSQIGPFMSNKYLCGFFSKRGRMYRYMTTCVTVTHTKKLEHNRALDSQQAPSTGITVG